MSGLPIVLVTQRVAIDPITGERRDALDQRWPAFLQQVGVLGIAVPNAGSAPPAMIETLKPRGILLTGGNDPVAVGGDTPERDATEEFLIAFARVQHLPLLGVCRGMQMLQQSFGIALHRVDGHVAAHQTIEAFGERVDVNSYHRFGTRETKPPLRICARADDGIIKAVRVDDEPILGIMWHPERMIDPRPADICLFRDLFGAA